MATLLTAVLSATNKVKVVLSEAPTTSGIHSALLPSNWIVTPGAAGAVVVAVEAGSATVEWYLTVHPVWTVVALQRVNSNPSTSGLRTDAGGLTYTNFVTFTAPMDVAPASATATERRRAGLDFALHTIGKGKTPAGCYAIEAGNYRLWSHTSQDAREADILRRCMVDKGAFSHLPAYGVGLRPKRLVSVNAMLTAKREIDGQLRREPGVQQVGASMSRRTGVLDVRLQVRTTEGGTITVAESLEA